MGILLLADDFFAEDINTCTHTHCSSHTSLSDVRHMRDAIIMYLHLISYVKKQIQLNPEDHIGRELSSAPAGHLLCIHVCLCECVCVVLLSTNAKNHNHATAAALVSVFSLERHWCPSSQSCHDLAHLRQLWLD